MFFPEGQIRVHLYGQPCDMRRSFDGLQALVRHGPAPLQWTGRSSLSDVVWCSCEVSPS